MGKDTRVVIQNACVIFGTVLLCVFAGWWGIFLLLFMDDGK